MIGSRIAVKKDPVAIQISAIEGLDNLIDAKNNIQCNPIIIPIPAKRRIVFLLSELIFLINGIKKTILKDVSKTLHHTSGIASSEIRSPSIAVNPHRNMAMCS
jgi:hypothetical protein